MGSHRFVYTATDPNGYRNTHRWTISDTNQYANLDPHANSYQYTTAHKYANRYQYTNGNPYAVNYTNTIRYTDHYQHTDGNIDSNRYPNTIVYTYKGIDAADEDEAKEIAEDMYHDDQAPDDTKELDDRVEQELVYKSANAYLSRHQ